MTYHCEMHEKAAQPTLAIRTTAAAQQLPEVLPQAYMAIMQYLSELGEYPAGMPYAAYFNMDMDNLQVEIGFPVGKALPGRDDIKASEIPAGKQASCLYTGPYDQCEPAYEALSAWIEAQGYEPTGVAYEFYLNDPHEVPPEEIQTLIMLTLK